MAHWDPSDDAAAECPKPTLSLDSWKQHAELEAQAARDRALRDENRRLTAEINAILERLAAGMLWSDRCRKRGDVFRADLSRDHEWRRAERSFSHLGEPANDPRGPRRPELYLVAGEHRAFVDPCGGEHPMHSGPLGPDPRTDDDPTCVELPVLGGQEVA